MPFTLVAALFLAIGFEPYRSAPVDWHILGAAIAGPGRLIVWGDRLAEWKLRDLSERALPGAGFWRGGCVMDVDADGQPDLVVQKGKELGTLTWRRGPDFAASGVIDTAIEMPDCVPATLHGKTGLLMVQRYAQVRFYEPAPASKVRWPYREIYSFYTNSRQAGLITSDVDGDGLTDILCGNYWIRSPARADLPWRLFAINTHHQTPDSATARLAMTPDLIFSQGELAATRIAVFRKPADPAALWVEQRLDPIVHKPLGLAAADFDGDGRIDFAVSDYRLTGSRLLLFTNGGEGRYTVTWTGSTPALHSLFASDVDRDGRPDLVAVGPASVSWWRNLYLRK